MCGLETTTLLPVAHELNETTGSQDRKSKQNERRKYVHKQTLQRERGIQLENWHHKFHIGISATVELYCMFYHVWPACHVSHSY